MTTGVQLETVLQRFDRSSPDRLLKSIAAEIVRLHEEIAALRHELQDAKPPAPPPHGVTIDADQHFVGAEGFYHLERDKMHVAYRWTGPKAEFSFTFAVDRSKPTKCALYFDAIYPNAPVEDLRAFVDGQEIALRVARAPERGHVATGELPARDGLNDTVLTFVSPATGSPRDNGYDDPRHLGLSFRLLEVGSAVQASAQPQGEASEAEVAEKASARA